MKQIFLVLFVAFVYTNALSQQNLVPNPSFEDYSLCPEFVYPELTLAVPWFDPWTYSFVAPGKCDAMFLHYCSSDSIILDILAFQEPRTDSGFAMAAFFGIASGGYAREYIEVELSDTLEFGKQYCVSLWVSLIETAIGAHDHIGLHFSDTMVYFSCFYVVSCPLYDLVPQVVNSNGIISDQENWVNISGSFIADGGERYLTIGNFHPLDSVNYISLSGTNWSYYFIDDVAVYECNTPYETALAGNDTIICEGDSLVLGSHNLPEYRYYWYVDSVLVSRDANPVFSPSQTTSYILQVKDFKFDESFDTIMVRVIDCDKILAEAAGDTLICSGDSALLTAYEYHYASYAWFSDLVLLGDSHELMVSPGQTQTYTLEVTDPKNRITRDEVIVEVEECDIPLDIPNVFTPNGDGKNDQFKIINPLEATLEISIFNRWGELIFVGDESNFWDGKLEDKTASEGVYFYQIKAIKTSRRITEYTGVVHLLR